MRLALFWLPAGQRKAESRERLPPLPCHIATRVAAGAPIFLLSTALVSESAALGGRFFDGNC